VYRADVVTSGRITATRPLPPTLLSCAMAENDASKELTLMPAPVAPDAAAPAVGVVDDDEQPATIATTATTDTASFLVFNNSSSPL
jgi:hypothetical protein